MHFNFLGSHFSKTKLNLFVFVFSLFFSYAVQSSDIHILPEVSRKTWKDYIGMAEDKIQLAAYRLSDPQIMNDLEAAHSRGVKLEILLEPDPQGHDKTANVKSAVDRFKSLKNATVFKLSNRFNQAHYKMIIVDGKAGLIGTDNLDQESFEGNPKVGVSPCRDFIVSIDDSETLKEMRRVFEADCKDVRILPAYKPLVWGPDFQRAAFSELINSAEKTLDIYTQDFQDESNARLVAGAARAGVKVRLLMMPFPFGGKEDKSIPNQNLIIESKGQLGLNEKLYIHAKVIVVDQKKMYVGSCNMYTNSMDGTRELGIIIEKPDLVQKVLDTFEKDWQNSKIYTQERKE